MAEPPPYSPFSNFKRDCAYLHWLQYKLLVHNKQVILLNSYKDIKGKRPSFRIQKEIRAEIANNKRKYYRTKQLISKTKLRLTKYDNFVAPIAEIDKNSFDQMMTSLSDMQIASTPAGLENPL